LYGAVAGGAIGFVNPFASNAIGLAVGGGLASLGGQAIAIVAETCKDPFDVRNYSPGAVIGSAIGSPIGTALGRTGSAFIDPIRRNLIGRAMARAGINRANQEVVSSTVEGSFGGLIEYVGNQILPANAVKDPCSCSR
jgi:hypothetical protein